MSARRVEMERLRELVRLHRMGVGNKEVARLLRMGPNTERAYRLALEAAGLLQGDAAAVPELEVLKEAVVAQRPPKRAPQQSSTMEAYRDEIAGLAGKGVGPTAIYDRLRTEREGFVGNLSAVKRLCVRLKRERGVREEDVVIPVETDPGEVVQVDFGYAGKLYDPETGVRRKTWVFVMTLGCSRLQVVRLVFDQRVETWVRLHVEAFQELGGVPQVVVPDNLKSAVIRAAFAVDEGAELNRTYRELARHYGFKVEPTPPRSPKKKGKVESAVKYVKRSYFRAHPEVTDIVTARAGLAKWVRDIANVRTHGTTGRKPVDMFEEERPCLLALPSVRYEVVVWKKAKVHADCHVEFDRRVYSVPWRFQGRHAWVRGTESTVAVYIDDERVATHQRRGAGRRCTDESHLPEHRAPWAHRSRKYWEDKAARMGTAVLEYIREVFDSDNELSRLRVVQSMVTMLEKYPESRAQAACERARLFGNYQYNGLKSILIKGLDLVPCADVQAPAAGVILKPKFAREARELFPRHDKETSHASDR